MWHPRERDRGRTLTLLIYGLILIRVHMTAAHAAAKISGEKKNHHTFAQAWNLTQSCAQKPMLCYIFINKSVILSLKKCIKYEKLALSGFKYYLLWDFTNYFKWSSFMPVLKKHKHNYPATQRLPWSEELLLMCVCGYLLPSKGGIFVKLASIVDVR